MLWVISVFFNVIISASFYLQTENSKYDISKIIYYVMMLVVTISLIYSYYLSRFLVTMNNNLIFKRGLFNTTQISVQNITRVKNCSKLTTVYYSNKKRLFVIRDEYCDSIGMLYLNVIEMSECEVTQSIVNLYLDKIMSSCERKNKIEKGIKKEGQSKNKIKSKTNDNNKSNNKKVK